MSKLLCKNLEMIQNIFSSMCIKKGIKHFAEKSFSVFRVVNWTPPTRILLLFVCPTIQYIFLAGANSSKYIY